MIQSDKMKKKKEKVKKKKRADFFSSTVEVENHWNSLKASLFVHTVH